VSGIWKLVLGGVAWGLAAYGALSLSRIEGEFGHSLCGPWGCYPPLQALVAMHLLWVIGLLPFVGWGLMKARPHHLCLAGTLLFSAALLGIVVVAGRNVLAWLQTMPPDLQTYWPWRALYAVVTLSDVPLLQGLLAGAICWSVGKGRERRIPVSAPPSFVMSPVSPEINP
jgi:hypothetical protein